MTRTFELKLEPNDLWSFTHTINDNQTIETLHSPSIDDLICQIIELLAEKLPYETDFFAKLKISVKNHHCD